MGNSDRSVQRDVTLAVDGDEAWEALSTEEGLEEWLASEVELDLREGGELILRYDDGHVRRGVIEEIDERRRLVLRWQRAEEEESRVEFTLEPVPAGTRLVVVETAGPTMRAAGAWEVPLARLGSRHRMSMFVGAP